MGDKCNNVEDITAWGHMKDTIMWTLSLMFNTKDSTNIAEKGCRANDYLTQGYEGCERDSFLLTPYLAKIIKSLIATAKRTDTYNLNLQFAAYEAPKEVVRCSNLCEASISQIITKLLTTVMSKLEETFKPPYNNRGSQDLQDLLCGVLYVIIQKLGNKEETKLSIFQAADTLMVLFLQVFASRSSRVQKEAMLAIGALVYTIGPEFEKHMSNIWKYLELGLQNFKDYEVCNTPIGVVRDICRSSDGKMILPYYDNIMKMLPNHISDDGLNKSVKYAFFSCFGDMAFVIGEQFGKYVSHAMDAMEKAAGNCEIKEEM
ncbi:hypothetical protein LXL04_014705 [Taraxacum kok-saghyz]